MALLSSSTMPIKNMRLRSLPRDKVFAAITVSQMRGAESSQPQRCLDFVPGSHYRKRRSAIYNSVFFCFTQVRSLSVEIRWAIEFRTKATDGQNVNTTAVQTSSNKTRQPQGRGPILNSKVRQQQKSQHSSSARNRQN